MFPTEKGFSQSDLDTFGDTISAVNVGSDCATDVLTCSLLNRMGYVKSGANLPSQVKFSRNDFFWTSTVFSGNIQNIIVFRASCSFLFF